MNSNQGALLNELTSAKQLSDVENLPDTSYLMDLLSNSSLPTTQNNTTSRIEGSYLKTYELNKQLPTPMNSFVESIYPLSELNNEIIQDISPFQLQAPPPYNPYNSSHFDIPYNSEELTSPPEPKKNFEVEAANLTRRIMTGNLKKDHSDEKSSNRLLVKQNIRCVEDLIGKKRRVVRKPKVAKRPYRRRVPKPIKAIPTSENTPLDSPTTHEFNKIPVPPYNLSCLATPSDLNFDISSVDNLNIDSLFESDLLESPDFHNPSPEILERRIEELVNTNPSQSTQESDIQVSAPNPSNFFPFENIITTPIDKTFDLNPQNLFGTKGGDILLTPSSTDDHVSLVNQIKNDGPLFEAISKKQKRGSYKCAHCPNTFPNLMEYAAHMDEYNIKREFKCPFPLCPWKVLGLPRRSDLRRHCAIQHKDELQSDLKDFLNLKDEAYPTILCSNKYCEKEFYRKDAFNRHVSIVHDNKKSRFNKKLSILLEQCPKDQTAEEKIEYVKENINKKRTKTKR